MIRIIVIEQLKLYYRLTKPGIIYGNVLTVIGGFLFGSRGHVNIWLLVATLLGVSLVIAAGCVFNNYLDRDLDKKMARTKSRVLATNSLAGSNVIAYSVFLGILGFLILALYVNELTLILGIIGLFFYIVAYSYFKRRSSIGTVVGSISGATPIAAGYCAATNRFDGAALLLFIILVIWQMPHFYAIAMFRIKDYAAAGLPVLPIKKGAGQTKNSMVLYIAGFIIATSLLTIYGYSGYGFLVIMALAGIAWLYKAFQGYKTADDAKWARQMFRLSLLVILCLSIMLSLDTFLL